MCCSTPTTHSLNNCITPLPTSLIRLDYKSATYSTPKSLLIQDCEFLHFFYSLNALIDVPTAPGFVNIINSKFEKFSICGAVLKNDNIVILGQRNTGMVSSPSYTGFTEDTDQKKVEDSAVYSYSS